LGISPASEDIAALDDWQINVLYEVIMSFPLEGLRQQYAEYKKSVANTFDMQDLLDAGYSLDKIKGINGE
jgi:hypothetical protein